MKKLTCKDLGGPVECSAEVVGSTFEEIGDACKAHVMEQLSTGDAAHLAAVAEMQSATPEEKKAMFAKYEQCFNDAPEGV